MIMSALRPTRRQPRSRRRPLWAITLAVVLLAAVVACGANTTRAREPDVRTGAASTSSCGQPAAPPGTETTVATAGFVREVAVVGDSPWVALRGGVLERLDPECHTSLASVDLAAVIPPSPMSGTVADFVALKAGDQTLWAIVEWLDKSGSPVATHVVRVDAKAAKATATTPLTQLDYSRTSNGLAVQGDSVWVADAVTAGTAAKVDSATGAVLVSVSTPAGAQSPNQDIATDDEGRLWIPTGAQSIAILDQTGVSQGQIDLSVGDVSNPGIVVKGSDVWLAGEQLRAINADTHTVLGTAPVKVGEMSPSDDGVWAVAYSPQQAVVHVSDKDHRVTVTYPVDNETVSLASQNRHVWRVDFDGVLHQIDA